MLHENITGIIIKSFYQVYNTLGYGFLEKVYENALAIELRERGLKVVQQKPIKVYYKGYLVGTYSADLLVEDCVICELKTEEAIHPQNIAQLVNYLKATIIEVGLLLNFGPGPRFIRQLFTNDRTQTLPPSDQ